VGLSAAGSNDSSRKSEEATAAADIVGRSNEEGGGAWQKIIRGLGREGGLRTLSKHFHAMKMFYRNEGV
jgi:hypothetical protein